MSGTIVVEKEMALTDAEFFRTLPRALGTDAFEVDGNRVRLAAGGRTLEIVLSGESRRCLGALALPVTRVRLEYRGYTEDEAAAAMGLFDRAYQRGGG